MRHGLRIRAGIVPRHPALVGLQMLSSLISLAAVEPPPLAPLPPRPERQPVLPPVEVASDDPASVLLRRIVERQRAIDVRLQALEAAGGRAALVMLGSTAAGPELTEARHARDEAWDQVRLALAERRQGIPVRTPDPIELSARRTGDAYLTEVEAENALLAAHLHHELYEQGGRRDRARLEMALAAWNRIPADALPAARQVEHAYLQIRLLAEDLRQRPPGAERDAARTRVEGLIKTFAAQHPGSGLVGSAQWLLAALELERAVEEHGEGLRDELGPHKP